MAGGSASASGSFIVNGTALVGKVVSLTTSGGNVQITVADPLPALQWSGGFSSEWSTATLSAPKNWITVPGSAQSDYVNAVDVTFADGATTSTVDLSVANVTPSSVTFSAASQAYTLGGTKAIAGAIGMALTGSGTVTINNTNSFTGAVTIGGGGTLVANTITNGGVNSALGAGTNVLLNGGTLSLTGGSASSDRNVTVAGASTIGVTNAATTLTLTGPMAASANLSKTGAGSLVLAGSGAHQFGTFSGGTNQFGNGGTAGTISGGIVNNAPLVFNHANGVTVGGIISGTGSVTKTGAGTLTLGAINTFSGPLTISNGTVNAAIVTTGGFASPLGEGYNTVTINTGALLTFTVGDRGCYHHGPININAGTVNFTGYDNSLGANPITFDTAPGFITGGGTLRLREAGVKIVVTAAASGSSISMGQLTLHDNLSIPFEVADGAAAVDLAISSVIKHAESGSGISKQGNGVMTMTVGGTYGGQTTVAAGKLGLSGGLASPVLVNSGATLFRGTANVGTMGITNSLTIDAGGTVFLKLNKTGGVLTNDSVGGLTSLTCNGTLIVTNITSDATLLALGDTVQLFSIGGSGFTSYSLPALPAGLTWDVSGLTGSGSITVVAGTPVTTVPTFNPPAGAYYKTGQTVTISALNPPGATIYYTTNGSTPTGASPSGISPVTITLPANTNLTIQAYAQAPSSTASSIASAAYNTVITTNINLSLASGPTAFWPLSELVGPTAFDLSSNGLNGAYGGAVTYGVAGPVGSTVVTLDGASGNVTVPYSATLDPNGPFSIEAWLNPAGVPASLSCPIGFYNVNGGGPKSGWALYQTAAGEWMFSTYNQNGSSAAMLLTGGTPTIGQWDHVAAVWDGSVGRIYVNGVLANTSAPTNYVANGVWPLTIGVRSDGFGPWPGSVGNVGFYGRALNAREIAEHAQNTPLNLNISKAGTDVVISWALTNVTTTLQAAPEVTGVYTNVPGATSPWTNAPAGKTFYRIQF